MGNRTSISGLAYTYAGTHPHAVTSAGTRNFTYDDNGSMLTDGVLTNVYDTRNRLISSSKTTKVITYTYDEGRERVTKTGGANPVTYINDYYEKEGTVATKFIMAGNMKIATVKGATTAYNHLDHLSGSDVSTATNRTVLELNDYTPWGSSRVSERATGYTNDYLFTGKELDEETNLYYYGARYYDPLIGRFTSIDPWGGDITDPQSLNKYAYARNNPLKYNDPTGENPLLLVAGLGAVAGVVAGIVAQGVSDIISGELSSFNTYTAAASGGMVQGALTVISPLLGGAVGNATTSALSQYDKNGSVDPTTLVADSVLGAVTSQIKLPAGSRGGILSTTRQMNTKLITPNSIVKNVTGKTAATMITGNVLESIPGTVMEKGLSTIGNNYYTVKPGDTLSGVFGSSWRSVAKENNLSNPSLIRPGQKLKTSSSGKKRK